VLLPIKLLSVFDTLDFITVTNNNLRTDDTQIDQRINETKEDT